MNPDQSLDQVLVARASIPLEQPDEFGDVLRAFALERAHELATEPGPVTLARAPETQVGYVKLLESDGKVATFTMVLSLGMLSRVLSTVEPISAAFSVKLQALRAFPILLIRKFAPLDGFVGAGKRELLDVEFYGLELGTIERPCQARTLLEVEVP